MSIINRYKSWLTIVFATMALPLSCSESDIGGSPGGARGGSNACGPGQKSCGGVCVDVSTSNSACPCPAGSASCGQRCMDITTSVANCGACGSACKPGELCAAKTCQCLGGLTKCGSNCVDVQSDPSNCGECGSVCTTGQVCSLGKCAASCDPGLIQCGASCVTLDTNGQNCGACGKTCAAGRACVAGVCTCSDGQAECGTACVNTQGDPANCGRCGNQCLTGATCAAGMCTGGGGGSGAGGSGGSAGSGGSSSGGTGGTADSGACQSGSTTTEWATSCPTPPQNCTAGTWTARPQGSDGHGLRYQSDHFAVYWHTSDPDGTGPLRGVASPPSAQAVQGALDTLETIWNTYFGAPVYFPEPYCNSTTKTKAAVHFDDYYPLWGGGWGSGYMGLWIGPAAVSDTWGLAHEFMHGVQSTTQAFPDCGGDGCWIFESHANWMPHQVWRDNPHYCSDMLPNVPHLYYGSTRDRYCNWQFFEFLKDKHCYKAVNDMWAYLAPNGQRDPWQKLMLSRGWNAEQLNDLFGEWAMHNITWDYKNPPPTNGSDQGVLYRQSWGSIENPQGWTERRLRLTRLEPLDSSWAQNRRFMSPYYWAPQRWGYNVVRLHPEAGVSSVRVAFRGVVQSAANSGWRWGLVATDANLTTSRYSKLQSGAVGELDFCINAGENLYLVVVATPTQYQKLAWTQPSDGPAYPSIYRYPYLLQIQGAWPAGFQNGQLEACPSGTVRHSNGGGCAPSGTPASVYVGPYARVVGGTVSGSARIENQATVVNGTVSGGTVGALSLIGVASHSGRQASSFNVSGSATVQTTFYPLGWFGNGQSASGTARVLGDVEFVSTSKSVSTFYGLVSNDWAGVSSASDVTVAPPYTWQ